VLKFRLEADPDLLGNLILNGKKPRREHSVRRTMAVQFLQQFNPRICQQLGVTDYVP